MKDNKIIKQGGELAVNGHKNDVKLTVPYLWYPDVQRFQTAVDSAMRYDYPRRKELYDLYDSALMDAHLLGVIRKRKNAVSQYPIEFQRNGEPVEEVNVQIRSPWFREFLKSCIDVKFWGFNAYQFIQDDNGWIDMIYIDHRHINPITQELLEYAGDINGRPLSSFPNTLFLGGKPGDVGELCNLIPWIITKRQTTGDWAQYAQIFGMPIREYTYNGTDYEVMEQLKEEAEYQGSNGIYFHTSDTAMNFVDAGSRSGSIELYDKLMQKCDEQISILILGNTLTTTVGDSGSRALGDVQKSEEEAIMEDDRQYVLDVLNYHMSDIFSAMGINTEGGEWKYVQKNTIDKSQQADIVVKMNQLGLPIDDEYLYETFDIKKPENYDEIIAKKEEEKELMRKLAATATANDDDTNKDDSQKDDKAKAKATLANRILGFFGLAHNQKVGKSKDFMTW